MPVPATAKPATDAAVPGVAASRKKRKAMPDPRERERAEEGRRPHRPAHQSQGDHAAEHGVGVHRHQHAAHRRVEHVGHEHHQHDRAHDRRAPEERVPLAQIGQQPAHGGLVDGAREARDPQRDEHRRHGERGGVDEQDVRRAERRNEHAPDRRAQHPRRARDPVEQARAPLERRPGGGDEVGQHRLAGSLSRRIEQRPCEDERNEGSER
jgi:hypothetical protein